MEFTQENFDLLEKRNFDLEMQAKPQNEFTKSHWLNNSQTISQIGSWNWDIKKNKVEWSNMMYTLLGLESNQQSPSYELALHHVHKDDKTDYEQILGKIDG